MKNNRWSVLALGLAVTSLTLSACGTPLADAPEPELDTTATTIKSVPFGGPAGAYTEARWKADWVDVGWNDGVKSGYASIIADGSNYKLQIKHPKGSVSSGTKWNYKFPGRNVATAEYTLKFKSDFDFVKGGKLPGLCGGNNNLCDSGGVRTSSGWSARGMWREGGKAVSYVYRGNLADPSYIYGEDFGWVWPESGNPVYFQRDRTYAVKQTVTMNTPGQADGKLEVWLDSSKVLTKTGIRWTQSGTGTIDTFAMHTFFGGNDATWAPKKDEYLWLDNFILSY